MGEVHPKLSKDVWNTGTESLAEYYTQQACVNPAKLLNVVSLPLSSSQALCSGLKGLQRQAASMPHVFYQLHASMAPEQKTDFGSVTIQHQSVLLNLIEHSEQLALDLIEKQAMSIAHFGVWGRELEVCALLAQGISEGFGEVLVSFPCDLKGSLAQYQEFRSSLAQLQAAKTTLAEELAQALVHKRVLNALAHQSVLNESRAVVQFE